MKLTVVLPALNEEATIGDVIRRIPREIAGIDEVNVIVVDDGSTDRTGELARTAGALVVRHAVNRGVGRAFQSGVMKVLELGSDYMVNMDADGQFDPAAIPLLLEPLIQGKAEFVTASRFISKDVYPEMSPVKFYGNKMMALLIGSLTGKKFHDVSCGFRAYSREALLSMNLYGEFTYTQETFLDLSFKGLPMCEVPVKIRGTREFGKSRVASNLFKYAIRTSKIIFRAFRDYKPLRFFGFLSFVMFLIAAFLFLFLSIHYLRVGVFTPHKWAGIGGLALSGMGLIILTVGFLADMLTRIRINQERILYMLRKNATRNDRS